ncbi:ATP-dependent DNA helicase [Trichonephila inaurata madagascariensis]|uniref:ATP-dependent DNA helicase n=1 Tax=Trichonephila inaurata madagascariensis TaxID=2747483 RepID=A0A8X7CHQ6_9ARAC|nr:ATP-dependent DNA helicase [Trichonephila inaurata madagascariensis]
MVDLDSRDFITNGGRVCNLKCTSEKSYVNNYNPIFLKLSQANMDIQPCSSNETIVHYIAKYISKSEPKGVTNSIAQAISEIRREESNISRQLFQFCMRMLKNQQVSTCKSIFRLGHLNLRESSCESVFLITRKPEKPYRMIKFNEVGHAEGFAGNIFERYEICPLGVVHGYNFNTMNLMTFAMFFEPYYLRRSENSKDNIDQDAYKDSQQECEGN